METVSAQEYQSVFSELQSLKEKFVALEQENHRLLGDLQQTALEKQQQHGELTLRVQQLEATIISLQQQASCSQGIHREPKIGLPTKFDGNRSQFRGFLNQVRLVIQMHPSRYPTDASRVGLVGTLLSGTALAWFAPLLEKNSPMLNNFEEFMSEFKSCFGDTDSVRTAINKIRRLRQGERPASAYAADFRLLASDIPRDDQALMEQFRFGLRNDVKDLLLTFPEEPKSLTEAISRAVRCDNRLFERRSERQFQMPRTRSEPTYASIVAKPFPRDSFSTSPTNTPTPMEIDTTRRRGPLSEEEKQRRRANRLCLYCGGPGHIAVNCPHRPKRQVNQITACTNSTKPESISLGVPDSLNNTKTESIPLGMHESSNSTYSPNLINKFDVLSQIEEELNY